MSRFLRKQAVIRCFAIFILTLVFVLFFYQVALLYFYSCNVNKENREFFKIEISLFNDTVTMSFL